MQGADEADGSPDHRGRNSPPDQPVQTPTDVSGMNPVSRKLIVARSISQTIWAAVLAGCFFLAQFQLGGVWWWGAVVAGVWYVFQLIMIPLRVRNTGWLETDNELLVTKGKITQKFTVVPYGRIQFVDVSTGPFTRPLGLKELALNTASATTDATIPGLPAAEADALRERLAFQARERMSGL